MFTHSTIVFSLLLIFLKLKKTRLLVKMFFYTKVEVYNSPELSISFS
jgi:hypothetical protein